MPDLLLELRSEEIPARMQRKAAGDLKKLVTDALVEAGLSYEGAREYWTPRRLTLDIRGLTARSADVREERKGPRTGANEKAIDGFLRGAGLRRSTEAQDAERPEEGRFLCRRSSPSRPRSAEEIIAEVMPGIIRNFPWPKSMRWGKASASRARCAGCARCSRSSACSAPSMTKPRSSRSRSTASSPRTSPTATASMRPARSPSSVSTITSSLEKAKVILDAERRKDIILHDARDIAFASGLELVEDEGLLEEVSGLVEWPQVLMGSFEEDYLDPVRDHPPDDQDQPEVFRHPQAGLRGETLSNNFILISNIEASDGGKEIIHGNGKVVRARLSDALHFWKRDQGDLPDLEDAGGIRQEIRPRPEEAARPAYGQARRAERHLPCQARHPGRAGRAHPRMAAELAFPAPAPIKLVDRAVVLAKADLRTEAVGEFPELQGLMGRKYAALQGEDASWRPRSRNITSRRGPSDQVPTGQGGDHGRAGRQAGYAVGFWAVDEKPTGSKDPFALRRAALGVIRIILERGVHLTLLPRIVSHMARIDMDTIKQGCGRRHVAPARPAVVLP
jgi:glycyl-tRNA synthetase beta chain